MTIEQATLFVGLVAIAIALRQLAIASKTLEKIDIQIGIANREVDLVSKDLANNQRMTDEALRRPDYVLAPQLTRRNADQFQLSFDIRNSGSRTSHGQVIEILVPSSFIDPSCQTQITEPFENLAFRGLIYRRSAELYGPLYPDWRWQPMNPGPAPLLLNIPNYREQVTVLWRVMDDFGKYPETGFHRTAVGAPPP